MAVMLVSGFVLLGYFRRFVIQDAVKTEELKVEDAVGERAVMLSAYATSATILPDKI